jgi:large subunit ribosomal protein L9
LTSYVAGIGRKGEVVNVAPTFAYNKLLIPGLAAYVTPENVEKYSKLAEEDDDTEVKHSSPFAQRVSVDCFE